MTGLLLDEQFEQQQGRPFAEIVRRQPALLSETLPWLARELSSSRFEDPGADAPIAFVAIGASRAACRPAAFELLRAGRWAQRFTGEELVSELPFDAVYIGVSQSGRSPEPLRALQRIGERRVITVTNEADSPMSSLGLPVHLGPLPDSGVSTIAYSATSAALSMLAERWIEGRISKGWDRLADGIAETIDTASTRIDEWIAVLRRAATVDIVGGEHWLGPAEALALVAREALHLPAAAFDTRSYLHGQTDSVSEAAAQILLGGEREQILRAELEGRNLCALQLSADPWAHSAQSEDPRLIALPGESPGQQAVAAAAVLHEVVRRWGDAIGVNPDTPVFHRLDTKASS